MALLFNNAYFSNSMKKHWVLLLTGIVTGLFLFIFLYFSHYGTPPRLADNTLAYFITLVMSVVAAYAIGYSNTRLDEYVPWKKQFIFRFTLALLVGMIIITMISLLGLVFSSLLNENLFSRIFNEFNNEWIKMLILSFFIIFIYQAAYFSIYSYQQYAVVQLNKLRENREQLRLQFDALKSQLSPHFLFNSLNTISSLVHKNPESAEEFIRRLASTYQYVISNKHEQLVSVEEEVEFIKSYYHLLKVRFEDSLKLEINLPENVLHTVIPPLTLQILIENAVKHNQIDEMNHLDIYIGSIDNTTLRITNNKGDKPPNVRSFKVGLDNIKKRYAYYSPRAIKINDTQHFSVELPVIPIKKAS